MMQVAAILSKERQIERDWREQGMDFFLEDSEVKEMVKKEDTDFQATKAPRGYVMLMKKQPQKKNSQIILEETRAKLSEEDLKSIESHNTIKREES